MKYTIETNNKVLRYKIDENSNKDKWEIKPFSDSDYAGEKDTRISSTGYCLYIYG